MTNTGGTGGDAWDVVIAGAGPTGLTLANQLGVLGLRTLVIEKLPRLVDYPRAVGIDDEALRSLQAIGLVDQVRAHTVPHQIMRFVDRRRRLLASIEPSAQPFGWPRRSGFIQPLVDEELARGLGRFPHVTLQFGSSVAAFTADDAGVSIQIAGGAASEADVQTSSVRTKFLVGCDGGRSTVRGLLGLPFDGQSESTRWLVIDIADDPIGKPNVYLVLDDDFPYVELGLPHGIRRYEFMVPAGADESAYESLEQIRPLLARVLPSHVRPNVIRHRVYTHHARIAPRFRSGRVFLAGDAAHLMPVWQGQGFNTGLRDATNLAWKLAMAAHGAAGEALLDSYSQERYPHAKAMIELSVLVGKIFVPQSPALRLLRNVAGPWVSRIGWLRRYIAEMRFKPMPFFETGIVLHAGRPDAKCAVGKMFPQPTVRDVEGRTRRLDDVIGLRFALVTWGARVDAWLGGRGRPIVDALDAIQVVVRPDCQYLDRDPPAVGVVVGDADGSLRRWFDASAGAVVIVRPDRIVAAVCDPWQIEDVLIALAARMQMSAQPVALAVPMSDARVAA